MGKRHLIVALAVLTGGCGVSRTTTLPQEWQTKVSSESYLDVTSDGDRVIGAAGKSVVALDGRTGRARWREAERKGVVGTLLSASNVRIGGVSLSPSDYEADRYAMRVLEDQAIVVMMDFSIGADRIAAVDLETGENLWASEELTFSFARYEALEDALRQIASRGGAVGTASRAGRNVSRTRREAEEPLFLEDLLTPVPGLDGFLFKTREGLSLLDARSGRRLWTRTEIDGLGLARAEHLASRGELIVVNRTPRDRFRRQIARLDAETGEPVWIAPYSTATAAARIHVVNGTLALESFGLQVYDYATGEKLWQTHSDEVIERRWSDDGAWGRFAAEVIIEDGAAYLVDNTSEHGFRCIDDCAMVVRKHDLHTGDLLWEAGPYEHIRTAPNLRIVDGTLVASLWSAEPMFTPSRLVGLDARTGAERWSSDEVGAHLRDAAFDSGAVFAALDDRVQRIDGRSGEVVFDVAHDTATVGGTLGIAIDAGDRIVVPAWRGVAAYDKADGTIEYAAPIDSVLARQGGWASDDDAIVDARLHGDILLLEHRNDNLSVVDPADGTVHGYAVVLDNRPAHAPFGDLYRLGYEITNDGTALYLMEGDGTVGKYRLNR